MVESIKNPLQYVVYKLFEKKSLAVIKYVDYHFQGKKRNNGEALMQHSLRMFKSCIASGIYDETILNSILLHDIVEDSCIKCSEIHKMYDSHIAHTVQAMTCIDDDGNKFDKEDYFDLFEQHCKDNWRVLFVKLFDCIDNLQTLGGLSDQRKNRFIKEKREVYLPIFEKYILYIPYEMRFIYNEKVQVLRGLLSGK